MRKITLACIALLLCAVLLPALADEFQNTSGFELVAQNDAYQLYLNYQKGDTLQFYVLDGKSGAVYPSSPLDWAESSDKKMRMTIGSQLLVTSVDKGTKAIYNANSQVSSVGEKGTTVTLVDGGFEVIYDFPREKDSYRIPVRYTLCADGLNVEVLFTKIEEYGDVYVQAVAVLPHFFAGAPGDEGYLLVPDGSGALIDFNGWRKGMSVYREALYGNDDALTTTQKKRRAYTAGLPVCGIQNGENALLAIADEGSALATVYGKPSGSSTVYSAAYFEFTYRSTDKMVLADQSWYAKDVTMISSTANNAQDIRVTYRFLSGDSAGYVGMAHAYGDYLLAKGLVPRAEATPTLRLNFYGAIKKERSVLGIIVTDLLPMTTFQKAKEILETLDSAGVDQLSLKYLGWNSGGLQDSVPDAAKPEGSLGGASGLKALEQYAAQHGIVTWYDVDFLRFYKTSLRYTAMGSAVQSIVGETALQYTYQVSTYQKNEKIAAYYLLRPDKVPQVAASFIKNAPFEGVSVQSLGEMVYSDFRPGSYTSREVSALLWGETANVLRANAGRVSTAYGAGYLLPYVDEVTDIPMTDSGFDVCSTDVPFLQIALHGLLPLYAPAYNLSEQPEELFLRLLETGTMPSYAVTGLSSSELRDTRYEHLLSTEFAVHGQAIQSLYQRFIDACPWVCGQPITGHVIDGMLRCTTFADGTRVYVNYGLTDGVLDGHNLSAQGFLVLKGGD